LCPVQQLGAPLARRPPSRPPSRGAAPSDDARMTAPADIALRSAEAAAAAAAAHAPNGSGFGAAAAAAGDAEMAEAADMLSSLQALSAVGGHSPGAPALGPPPPLGIEPPGFGGLQPPFAPPVPHRSLCP
jgi:hypothetical protein